jgi:hypothetical protein
MSFLHPRKLLIRACASGDALPFRMVRSIVKRHFFIVYEKKLAPVAASYRPQRRLAGLCPLASMARGLAGIVGIGSGWRRSRAVRGATWTIRFQFREKFVCRPEGVGPSVGPWSIEFRAFCPWAGGRRAGLRLRSRPGLQVPWVATDSKFCNKAPGAVVWGFGAPPQRSAETIRSVLDILIETGAKPGPKLVPRRTPDWLTSPARSLRGAGGPVALQKDNDQALLPGARPGAQERRPGGAAGILNFSSA